MLELSQDQASELNFQFRYDKAVTSLKEGRPWDAEVWFARAGEFAGDVEDRALRKALLSKLGRKS